MSSLRRSLNVLAVFGLSGLWHGASWTFVVWGGLNGLFIVTSERTVALRDRLWRFAGPAASVRRPLARLVTFALICITWVYFRATSMSDAWYITTRITVGLVEQVASRGGAVIFGSYFLLGWTAVLVAVLLAYEVAVERRGRSLVPRVFTGVTAPVAWGLAAAFILAFGVFSEASQFIYFQF